MKAKTVNRYYPPPRFDWAYFLHNLRNNLGAVVGFFECFETMPATAAAMTPKMVGQFRRASEKALKDIEEASQLSGPLSFAPVELPLEKWLREQVNAHPVSGAHKVVVDWKSAPGAPAALRADAEQFARALREVLDNALEAMGEGGALRISISGKGSRAAIEIHNSGPAIASDHLESVTEPFFTTKQAKRGLGLAWARKILEEQGGKIEVHNAKEGGVSVILQLG